MFVALLEKRPEDIAPGEYLALLRELKIRPRIVTLGEVGSWSI
jgi:hypothetical protein